MVRSTTGEQARVFNDELHLTFHSAVYDESEFNLGVVLVGFNNQNRFYRVYNDGSWTQINAEMIPVIS